MPEETAAEDILTLFPFWSDNDRRKKSCAGYFELQIYSFATMMRASVKRL